MTSGQAAACWLTAAGRFAYTTDAGNDSSGRISVSHDRSLSLTGTTVLGTGSNPLDECVSEDQNLVYVLVDDFHQIIGYRVGANGELTQITATSVPAGAAGIGAF